MSNIEWTDTTWNPVIGCTPVSPGCLNCYAATMARRLEAMGRPEYLPSDWAFARPGEGESERRARVGDAPEKMIRIAEVRGGRAVFTGEVRALPQRLAEPLRWRKPRRVFVNSMSDLFHEDVPFEFIDRVFAVMALCPQHTFQVLTKRPERMAEYLRGDPWRRLIEACVVDEVAASHPDTALEWHVRKIEARHPVGSLQWPLPNVWLGTSVENQATADERIPHLLRCPAQIRFLSCEPLLEAVDLSRWLKGGESWDQNQGGLGPSATCVTAGRRSTENPRSTLFGRRCTTAAATPRTADSPAMVDEESPSAIDGPTSPPSAKIWGHGQAQITALSESTMMGTTSPATAGGYSKSSNRATNHTHESSKHSEWRARSASGSAKPDSAVAPSLGDSIVDCHPKTPYAGEIIHWVIVGGESGANARPCDVEWIRSVVRHCRGAGVACFVKQLGAAVVQDEQRWRDLGDLGSTRLLSHTKSKRAPDGTVAWSMENRKGGDPAEWPEDLRVREWPRAAGGVA